MGKVLDLTGQRFGMLVVISRCLDIKHKRVAWKCKCDCGGLSSVYSTNLTSGLSKSCGCQKRGKGNTTHGGSGTRLYKIWNSMNERCGNPKNISYHNYGGRGIKICDCLPDFQTFRDWAMLNEYTDSFSIERKDNNYDYCICSDNLRWATRKEQSNNTRKNTIVEIDGISRSISEWSEIYCISKDTVFSRISKGLDPISALTFPIDKSRKGKPVIQLNHNGIKIAQYESAWQAHEFTGVSPKAINAVCNGKRLTAGSYKWRFVLDS